ncbi:hypothetical protein [Mesorhizobium sp. ES1-4]|uniref:hypothetical protein n=1 Tax=Mesorhizobium sp. ES1-4 TaxID=2876627 RepID=UPI001CCB57E4|nr:hypothetical protein [Mesorhizobium sp. ES1-4]MBZ9798373.1 hypothetical protein [Mesorhizobium sp. ES1-4]
MAEKPNDEMLPPVRGCTLDVDDKDMPRACLAGLLTEDGTKSFTLNERGARTMMLALKTFLDLVAANKAEQPNDRAQST